MRLARKIRSILKSKFERHDEEARCSVLKSVVRGYVEVMVTSRRYARRSSAERSQILFGLMREKLSPEEMERIGVAMMATPEEKKRYLWF